MVNKCKDCYYMKLVARVDFDNKRELLMCEINALRRQLERKNEKIRELRGLTKINCN